MDRKPLLPPFPKGTRLKYTGTRRAGILAGDGTEVPYVEPGLVVTVARTRLGYHGTLRPLPGDWDEAPPLDATQDGYSVYEIDVPGQKPFGRIIWPANADEWERVAE